MEGRYLPCLLIFDCIYSFFPRSKSFALVDGVGHIIARCIGFPPDPNWTSYCAGACAAMDTALNNMGAPQRDPNGRRGWFWTLFTGFSMGGGQEVCVLLSNLLYFY